MCPIFTCIGWGLDYIQRAITFLLACILCFFVCIIILVAIIAGIAYGYNYSLSEYLSLKSPEITVYMRRGQFYDKPDLEMDKTMLMNRRMGNEDVDVNDPNSENQEPNPVGSGKSLPEAWNQMKDTRKYAEALNKFSKKPDDWGQVAPPEIEDFQKTTTTTQPSESTFKPERSSWESPVVNPARTTWMFTFKPTPTLEETPKHVFQLSRETNKKDSHILMRNFQSIPGRDELYEKDNAKEKQQAQRINKEDYPEQGIEKESNFYALPAREPSTRSDVTESKKTITHNEAVDIKKTALFSEDYDPELRKPRLSVPVLMPEFLPPKVPRKPEHENTRKTTIFTDDLVDYRDDSEREIDVDEDNVVYKPV